LVPLTPRTAAQSKNAEKCRRLAQAAQGGGLLSLRDVFEAVLPRHPDIQDHQPRKRMFLALGVYPPSGQAINVAGAPWGWLELSSEGIRDSSMEGGGKRQWLRDRFNRRGRMGLLRKNGYELR